MERNDSLLLTPFPTAVTSAQVHISHVQLRDLVICPRERGIVNYVQRHSIVEQNLHVPNSTYTLAEPSFSPTTLTSLSIGENDTLIAAGGPDAEIHISYHSSSPSRHHCSSLVWQFERQLHGSINNSVLLTSLNLGYSNESSVEPRVGISNNDCTVRFYDVPIRLTQDHNIKEAGFLKLDVPINHSSISPDGRTLLSVGDSNTVYFHAISGGSQLAFSPLCTVPLPPLTSPSHFWRSLTASFSTAFSADGTKFAVASQEGMVAVWDVRNTKPLKIYETNKTRLPSGLATGGATIWMSDDPWEWTRGSSRAPGWSARSVKFSAGKGHETMAFTEHTSFLHVVDARTFETEDIIRVPIAKQGSQPTQPALQRASSGSTDGDSIADNVDFNTGSTENTFNSGMYGQIDDKDAAFATRPASRRMRQLLPQVEVEYRDDLDITGLCFDPSGSHIYAASTEAVVEWGLTGS